jgi:hypothetical protein
MSKRQSVSPRTRNNWLVNATLFLSAVVAALSGIYFLIFTSGGFDGGRNPWYGVVILFTRHTWEEIHVWGGLAMVAAVIIHLIMHQRWIQSTTRRLWQQARGTGGRMARGALVNLAINSWIGAGFLVTAISGIYFFLLPEGGYQGGQNPNWDPGFLFSRPVWDMLHTWGGISLIIAALLHIHLHWGWIVKVAQKMWRSVGQRPASQTVRETL